MDDSTEKTLRKMEEEMSRFEAEIASQPGPPGAPQLTGGFVYGQPLPYATPVNNFAIPLLSAPGVYMSSFAAIPPTLPPSYTMQSAVPRKPVEKTPAPTVAAPAKTIISAPPQMAGPEELAARAKETAAAAEAAKLKALEVDDDDDVTRALLAAEAGVTYTRTTGPNGKESVKTKVLQPPRSQPAPKPAPPPPAPVVTSVPETVVAPPPPPIPPPPMYSIRLDTSVPPPSTPMPAVRHTQTTTEEPYSFQKKVYRRVAAGMVWEDPTLAEWDPNDFRLFCGDLGNEVSDDTLTRAFSRYPSFQKAKVIVDKRSGKSRGYGFVSFSDPSDFTRAMREMNGKYIGNRPIKLKKSDWKNRQLETYRKREKEKRKLGLRI